MQCLLTMKQEKATFGNKIIIFVCVITETQSHNCSDFYFHLVQNWYVSDTKSLRSSLPWTLKMSTIFFYEYSSIS